MFLHFSSILGSLQFMNISQSAPEILDISKIDLGYVTEGMVFTDIQANQQVYESN